MQAVILAGERGTPLYPLTARQPRAMLPLAGKPLVQYQLELLKRHGCEEAILCLQVQPQTFEERFKDGKSLGLNIHYHREQAPLGTAGAVRSVATRLLGEYVLILNGHNLTDADLTRLIDIHGDTKAAVTLLLARVPDPSRYGVVVCDREGRIRAFAEKPTADEAEADTVNAGVYLLRRDLLRRMPPDTEYSFERQLFPQLLAEGVPMYGVVNEGRYWRSIATLTDYQQAQADILEKRVEVEIAGNPLREGVWVGEAASVHPTADLRGRVFVNHHTEIARDVKISGVTSIGSRCRVGEGAVIEDSIIWRGTVIEAGAVVRGCILGDNCVVRAGATVQPGSVVGSDGIIASVVAKLPTRGDLQRDAIKFGSDGWRGVLADDFTVDNVRLVAQAVTDWMKSGREPGSGLMVGYDRRAQSETFAEAVAQVATANGLPVKLSAKACPSAVVGFACRYFGASAGVVITAGVMPPKYNGLSLRTHYGGEADPETYSDVDAKLRLLLRSGASPRGERKPIPTEDIATPYCQHVARFVDLKRIASAGFKVVIDAMHGSGAGYLAGLLRDAGVAVTEIRADRNPYFGGTAPEPVWANLSVLYETVKATGADIGLALDGDADRLGACDSTGAFRNNQGILAVLLKHLVEGRGWRGGVVRTVATTRLLDKLAAKHDLPLIETPIGFRFVCEKMLAGDILLGADETGGMVVKNHLPERDAILMGLLVLEAMAMQGKRLEELLGDVYAEVGEHHYRRVAITPAPEMMHRIIGGLQSFNDTTFAGSTVSNIVRRDGTRLEFADGSWLLLRPSGTEPLVRLYAEAPTTTRTEELLAAGATLIENL